MIRMRLTFVGTGVSCAIPVIGHVTTNCACRDAIENPSGPNRRNNVSMLISLSSGVGEAGDEVWHHALVDCGKTYRNAYMRVLAPMGVRCVDALLVTHGHADAMQCVEDVCAMQTEAAADYLLSVARSTSREENVPSAAVVPRTLRRLPTFLTEPTLDQIAMVSPKLVERSLKVGAAPATRAVYCSALAATDSMTVEPPSPAEALSTVMDIFFMDEKKPQRMYVPLGPLKHPPSSPPAVDARIADPVEVGGAEVDLPFFSFPVEHGKGYTSMAWVFGRGTAFKSQQAQSARQEEPQGSCVVYISDVSDIPPTSMAFLQDLVKIDVLVLDLLAGHGAPPAPHYGADEAVALVVALAPRRTYFVGMFCSLEHQRTNELLALELAQLKARYRKELQATAPEPLVAPATEQEKKKYLFLNEVCSMELAYDGQVLDMDA